jgi:hypothetical protein
MRIHVLPIVIVLAILPSSGFAQEKTPDLSEPKKFEIVDNSFFVEEAFNQDRGVFQNIFSWSRDGSGDWIASFTQEWPAPNVTHQLSYTIPFVGGATATHFGGVLLNYRMQVFGERQRRPAFSPRFSVILPTGRDIDETDRPGVQFNLPFSKQFGDFYVHLNAGATWLHGVSAGETSRANLTSPVYAGSVIWHTRPYLNLMLESVLTMQDTVIDEDSTSAQRIATIAPGIRGGWTIGDRQVVLGGAVPITFAESEPRSTAFLVYFSYELPFTSNHD